MLNALYTAQGEAISQTPWQEYPRPQLKRDSYVNLNGWWEFAVTESSDLPETYEQEIVVPFCPECMLSLADMGSYTNKWLFYRRSFTLPKGFQKDKVLLHIGAAIQVAKIYVNQQLMGEHTGGYEAFSLDITDALKKENEIVIAVFNDLQDKTLPYGKQSLKRGGMWYTPASGIWQTVWLESVTAEYVQSLDIQVTLDSATITVTPPLSGKILLDGKTYPLIHGQATITPENPQLWTPESPYLYNSIVETESDRVESYFALRTIEAKEANELPRLCLNGKPYFFHGLLDQGYWSDGIYTPASPACFEEDILKMKELGFNTLRKHIKVEPELFYYACDKLGMVVFQDMVNNGDYSFFRDTALPTFGIQKRNDKRMHKDKATRQAFLQGMVSTVKQLKNHPCIVYWTIFNEGWGQFNGSAAYRKLKQLDRNRIIDTTSGWFRGPKSDVDSRHIYFTPWSTLKPSDKPLVLSEFGGYAYAVEDHIFNTDKSYGYKSCKSQEHFQTSLSELYITKVLPAIERGLCAAIITQVSDVEDEINGMLTYDRKVCKADTEAMQQIAKALQDAFAKSCIATSPQD